MTKWEYKFIDVQRLPEFEDWEFCALLYDGVCVLRRRLRASNGSAPLPWGWWGENE